MDREHSTSDLGLGKQLDGERDCELIRNPGYHVLSGHP